ncbi:MBOAT family O-acyltransferase [Pedobacter sp. JY14-1]|uniref:MBOAT family O-acyltransferase n=1 Tax=Pedobacter sp. JY14-1 TaxID=3034151 RepID=UPI0023E0B4DD|nr:MBOAT family O-acyltransferase [Pedobacter sp. JY14-1]
MLFNSFEFLVFFPVVTIIYFLLPFRLRWIHLLIFSCVFYCFFVPAYLFVLAATIIIDYAAGIFMERAKGGIKKAWLLFSILSTVAILAVFKYYNFINDSLISVAHSFGLEYTPKAMSLILPIGLSFHTFQSLSYVIEVYRGNQTAERHFGIYALYVMFYPQLVAGPIERPQNILHQFRERHRFEYANVTQGLKLMVFGFFKKLVVADRLALYVDSVYTNHDQHNGISLAVATILFAFQIYCDFSGYSDIAIGAARVMGFKLMTNFNRPYFARSVSEFWKRWHISLSTWFRDYVYIPLGGNRTSGYRVSLNILITFCLSGLWHGANWTFVIWGALNGLYLVIERVLGKPGRKVYGIVLTFLLINISWVFFRAESASAGVSILNKIFTQHGAPFLGDNKTLLYGILFLGLLLASEFVQEFKLKWFGGFFSVHQVTIRRLSYIGIVLIIMLFGVLDNSQFIYFQF